MEEEKIRQIMDQIDPEGKISEERISELIQSLKDLEDNPPKDGDPVPGHPGMTYGVLEGNLKGQMSRETDWRKKASIAARIISLNLE